MVKASLESRACKAEDENEDEVLLILANYSETSLVASIDGARHPTFGTPLPMGEGPGVRDSLYCAIVNKLFLRILG